MGVEGPNISLARWLAVCAGAFLMNAGYAVFLMVRSRSWVTLRNRGAGQSIGFGLLAGAFWFLSFGVSGLGMQRLGPLGLPIGWPMLLGIGLIVSTCWSLAMGEWKGATSAFRIMAGGIFVLIVSICLLGYARSIA
jgi:L-rhamnose-H+ transport protein